MMDDYLHYTSVTWYTLCWVYAVTRHKMVKKNNLVFPCIHILLSVSQRSHVFSDVLILRWHLYLGAFEVVH